MVKSTITYKFLMMFSSLVKIIIQDITITTANSGFDTLGIMQITMLNKTYLTIANSKLHAISHFI